MKAMAARHPLSLVVEEFPSTMADKGSWLTEAHCGLTTYDLPKIVKRR